MPILFNELGQFCARHMDLVSVPEPAGLGTVCKAREHAAPNNVGRAGCQRELTPDPRAPAVMAGLGVSFPFVSSLALTWSKGLFPAARPHTAGSSLGGWRGPGCPWDPGRWRSGTQPNAQPEGPSVPTALLTTSARCECPPRPRLTPPRPPDTALPNASRAHSSGNPTRPTCAPW